MYKRQVFFSLECLLLLFLPSFDVVGIMVFGGTFECFSFLLRTFVNRLSPLYFVIAITFDFGKLTSLVNKICYEERCKQERNVLKRWQFQCLFRKLHFDCGYADMDFSFISIAFNYCILCVSVFIE